MPSTERARSSVLFGSRVAVTRPRHQQASLTSALESMGAEVVSVPLIEIVEDRTGIEALRAALVDADAIAWLVVTSPNGARVVSKLHEEGCALPPIAAVGEATAREIGHAVDLVSRRASAASLVEDFPAGAGGVVLVQGERADATLFQGIASKGWHVSRCNVYRTLDVELNAGDLRDAATCDAVVLASGSAASNWARLVGADFAGVVVVIGDSTRTAAESVGITVSAQAEEPSVEGIIAALCSALSP